MDGRSELVMPLFLRSTEKPSVVWAQLFNTPMHCYWNHKKISFRGCVVKTDISTLIGRRDEWMLAIGQTMGSCNVVVGNRG